MDKRVLVALLWSGCHAAPTTVRVGVALADGAAAPGALAVSLYDRTHALLRDRPIAQSPVLPGALILEGLPDVDQPLRVAIASDAKSHLLGGARVTTSAHAQ